MSKKTIDKCESHPNKVFKLSTEDRRLIKAHVTKILCAGEIQKVRLMEEKDFKTELVWMNGKKHESKIRFQGIDSNNVLHVLSDDWLKLNFETYTTFYEQIMSLETYTGKYYIVPVGKLKNEGSKWPLSKREKGPAIKYRQLEENSCLFCSVASAFSQIHQEAIAQKVMSVYDILSQKTEFQPYEHTIIELLRNKYKEKGETRLKINILKQHYTTVNDMLEDVSHDILFIVLSNRHAVCLVGNYILDPTFEHCLPRSEKCIQVCAEITNFETSNTIIKKAYSFDCPKKK